MAVATKIHRSHNAYVAGVCAGFAEAFNLDTLVVRILAVLLVLATFGIAAIVYLVLWFIIPPEQTGSNTASSYEVMPVMVNSENRSASPFGAMGSTANSAADTGSGLRRFGRASSQAADADGGERLSIPARVAVAVVLVALFVAASMNVSPLLHGIQWWQLWPVAFLIAGLCLIVIPVHSRREAIWHAAGIAISSVAALFVPMSVDILSWGTIPYACSTLWFLLGAAVVLFGIGVWRNSGALAVAGAFCVMLFCLLTLFYLGVPGEIEEFTVFLPSGRLYIMGPGFRIHQFMWLLMP